MYEFRMPSLGADMEAGTLSRWLVKPGDHVNKGDIVAIVETEKSDIEVEIFTSGTVERLLVETGRRVPVGTILATFSTDGDAAASSPPPSIVPVAAPSAAPPASPAARQRATELGLDLAKIAGSGPGGAVTLGDVEQSAIAAIATATPAAPPATARDRAASMRRAIAAAMSRSNREIPHYYLAAEIDMSRALARLREENLKRPVETRLLPAVLLLKVVALALRKVPELNGFWENDAFRPGDGVHLGVAVSIRGGGLIAPAIHDADRKSLDELMAALNDLVQRARAGTLRSSEMTDPTVTVTNLGDQAVGTVFGVIQPPQVALVGFGGIAERPWAEAGRVEARPIVTATLSADHRATDGHRGSLFLSEVDRLLQKPESL